MIRFSEAVLPGHPDKFCDQVADSVVRACQSVDRDAYCQVEVSIWADQVWLSGGVMTRTPLDLDFAGLVARAGAVIGYDAGNLIDASRYKVSSTVWRMTGDPGQYPDEASSLLGTQDEEDQVHRASVDCVEVDGFLGSYEPHAQAPHGRRLGGAGRAGPGHPRFPFGFR